MKKLLLLTVFILSSQVHAESQSLKLKISQEGATVLNVITAQLVGQKAAVSFPCDEEGCKLVVDQALEPELDLEAIERPFTGGLLVLRLHGGSQQLQKAIYQSLETLSPTRDFQGLLDERKVSVDGKSIKFRCVSSREEIPQYECWVLISAAALTE